MHHVQTIHGSNAKSKPDAGVLSYFLVYCLLQGLTFMVQWVLYKVKNDFKFKAKKAPFHTETLALTYAPPLDLEHTIHPGLGSNLAV